MRFCLSMLCTIALVVTVLIFVLKNINTLFNIKLNFISLLVLCVCTILSTIITVLYGIDFFS